MSLKITFDQFLSLPTYEKFDVIFIKGDFLDARTEKKRLVVLYAIEQFFVELYYDPGSNKIIKVKSFEAGENLNKYSKVIQGTL